MTGAEDPISQPSFLDLVAPLQLRATYNEGLDTVVAGLRNYFDLLNPAQQVAAIEDLRSSMSGTDLNWMKGLVVIHLAKKQPTPGTLRCYSENIWEEDGLTATSERRSIVECPLDESQMSTHNDTAAQFIIQGGGLFLQNEQVIFSAPKTGDMTIPPPTRLIFSMFSAINALPYESPEHLQAMINGY